MAFLSLVFTTACQKQSPENNKEKVTASTQPNQSTSTNVHPPSPIQTQPQSLSQVQSTPIPEKVDLTQAHDINQDKDLTYLTALFLSKTTRQMTDDEKLGLMSAEYANESDAFKKRELANKLLPQLNTTLDKYKGTYSQ